MPAKICKYFLILCLCWGSLLKGEELAYTLVTDETHVPILAPSVMQRQTLKLRLTNGLEAYLISDPETIHAGAVLTVQAGSWHDPDPYPGLAHFLEHMLFLGTEKYPIESEYDQFIRTHDGQSNAYTSSDYTLYLFSINSNAFEEALDRFSFFFKKPLFNPSGVERELNAINQEFAKNFNQDAIRENYVQKALANQEHPFHRFSTGNSTTLAKVTQKILKEWYQEHYSAHHMRLIVYGPQSLETLKQWVVKDFQDISSSGKQFSSPQVPLLSEKTEGKIVYIEPIKNIRTLRLTWELPAMFARQSACQPENIIASLLGHEGKGSLLAALKAEGLAEQLSSGGYHLGKQQLLFSIYIQLTEEGLDNISQVIERCFQSIHSLQQQDLPIYLFEESKKIRTLRYQYQSREDTFDFLMNLGGLLVYEELNAFPENALIPQTFDQKLIHAFLEQLTPQRTHFTVMARHPSLHFDQQEKWMEIPYKIASIHPQQLQAWSALSPHSQLHLPPPNPFIPQELKLVQTSSERNKQLPSLNLLVNHEQAKIYFAADHHFNIPQTLWFFEIKTPAIENNDPHKVVLADLYIQCLEEALQPYSYPAQLADLSYEISRTTNGLHLSLTGYRDNAETLFDAILMRLKNCRPTEHLFHIFKESLLRRYRDSNQESPLKQGMETYHSILFEFYTSFDERAEALEKVTYSIFLEYIAHLFDQTYTEGLLYGDIDKNQALKIWEKLEATLSNHSFPSEKRLVQRILVLPPQVGPFAIDHCVQSSADAAILGIENGPFSFKRRAAQQILTQAMNSAFYSTLRTQQQTGYLVFSYMEELDKHLFSFFAVQSTTHDPRDLLARFELFIESFLQEMENSELTQEHFEDIRQSLLNSLENIPQNLVETGQLLKTVAFKYEGDFEWMSKRIQGLKELTYQEFLEMSKEFLGKQNKQRLAILVRGTANKNFQYHALSSPQEIRDISQYTRE